MPTYTNASTTETKIVVDVDGVIQHVVPGGSIQTYDFLGTGWTETAATPVFNPVLFATTITLTADGSGNSYITFDPNETKTIRITGISDEITSVNIETVTTTPALYTNLTISTAFVPEINNSEGRIRKLIFSGSGTCVVTGYSE